MPIFPVPILGGAAPTISDSYGYSPKRGRLHAGSDIMYRRASAGAVSLPAYSKNYYMPNGVQALAYDAGVVTRSGLTGTGGRVEIDHGGGLRSLYYHLSRLDVRAGDRVGAGKPVGIIGHNPTGYRLNHLHFEIHKNGRAVDPAPYLARGSVVNEPTDWLLAAGIALAAGYAAYKLL